MSQYEALEMHQYPGWASASSSPAYGHGSRLQSPASASSPASGSLGSPNQSHTVGGPYPSPCMPLSAAPGAPSPPGPTTPTRTRRERQKMKLALTNRPYVRRVMSTVPSSSSLGMGLVPVSSSPSGVDGAAAYPADLEPFLGGPTSKAMTTTTSDAATMPDSPGIDRLPTPDVCPLGDGPFCACCLPSSTGSAVVRPQDLQYWAGRESMDAHLNSARQYMGRAGH